ncbi:hypothetical protein M436DRAFT_62532 [Aureobasidium namibiae CBS 147.97]|uniref:F-box domain-containing protein n=1 Tax=Aureobasidium namibiae CBS 147.97 TaxID=1043004 RepID=A0A074WUE1_9PEZI|nr:uncharacterized protein M436DRAFT_62532 [Aureobasidium namibiae CBS 147.97]KEQ75129.1 hypothetical protein M436DRAFT_62532 [Aureobasidium namibiae CBS 147.97]
MTRPHASLVSLHPFNSGHRRRKTTMSLGSRNTTPCSRLENLPPELRYMIYSHLLTDRKEQRLFHPLAHVSKQISADFGDTITRLLGNKAQLTVEIKNKTVYFELGFHISVSGEARFQDAVTGSDSRFAFHTGWNVFRGSEAGRQMLARTMRVMLRWPSLKTTFWIIFEAETAPDVDVECRCRLSVDARTRVASEDAEKMLERVAKDWRGNEEANSAVWTDAFIRDLRWRWKELRNNVREAKRREAYREAGLRRVYRELHQRQELCRSSGPVAPSKTLMGRGPTESDELPRNSSLETVGD